jgi:thioredoxin 1
MRIKWQICALAQLLIWQAPTLARSASTPVQTSARPPKTGAADPSAYEVVKRWRAAVMSGDKAALGALYATAPPARAQTPQGNTLDPSEEPAFWSALASRGLVKLDPKVLEIQHPQPGAMSLVLRIEIMLGAGARAQPYVVSAAQIWVQQGNDWHIYATQRSDLVPNPTRRLPEPARPNADLYPPPEQAPSEIQAALARAASDQKRIILVFGGNWCYDCHVLDETFHLKSIAPLINANFHVVHINVGEYDKNLDLAKKYDIPLQKGVPSLAVLNPDGTLVFSQKQGEFESSTRLGPEDVVQFLTKWKPVRKS